VSDKFVFPQDQYVSVEGAIPGTTFRRQGGLTVRQFYKAAALSNPGILQSAATVSVRDLSTAPEKFVVIIGAIADAMLAEDAEHEKARL
jgi:hypothetical protein